MSVLGKLDKNNQTEKALYTAFLNYTDKALQSDGERIITQIEARRKSLYSDASLIERIDYGTGIKDRLLSDEGTYTKVQISRLAKGSSKPARQLALLFHLIQQLKPGRCLEMGTCFGLSAGYQGAALFCNKYGFLISIEGAPAVARMATENIQEWGLKEYVEIRSGSFQRELMPALHVLQAIDYVFIDGHHDGKATIGYFNTIVPYLKNGAVLIFDDIDRSPGMWSAWKYVRNVENISLSIKIGGMGIALLSSDYQAKRHLTL